MAVFITACEGQYSQLSPELENQEDYIRHNIEQIENNPQNDSHSKNAPSPVETESIKTDDIFKITGRVDMGSNSNFDSTKEGTDLTTGQTLRTSSDSAAALHLGDGIIVVLNENSEVNFHKIENKSVAPELNFDLLAGEIFIYKPEPLKTLSANSKTWLPSNFRVKVKLPWLNSTEQTPFAELSFSGDSAYSVAVDPGRETIHSSCLDGQCALDQSGVLTNFEHGQVVLVRKLPGKRNPPTVVLREWNSDNSSIWVSAITFAKTPTSSPVPIPYPVLEQYLESDPAPFPFSIHEHTVEVLNSVGDISLNNTNYSLSVGDKLFIGDDVHTDAGAGLVLQVDDGTRIILNEATAFHLTELNGSKEKLEAKLLIEGGELFLVNQGTTDSHFNIELAGDFTSKVEFNSSGDPGFAFNVAYFPETGDYFTSVLDGDIEVVNRNGKFEIPPGYERKGNTSGGNLLKGEAEQEIKTAAGVNLWLGALDFAGIESTAFASLLPFSDSDMAPFPVLALPSIRFKALAPPDLFQPVNSTHPTDTTHHHIDLHHIH